MSENKHTPEPWPVFTDIATIITPDPNGTPVAILSWDDYIRARACVNACAWIPTETIEAVSTDRQFWPLDLKGISRKGLITLLGIQNLTVQGLKKQADSETRKKLKNQRDELLETLKKSADAFWKLDNADIHAQEAEAAIASVKGGA